jgi:DNA-directed RNA polymerase subunit RPC12/RpoP
VINLQNKRSLSEKILEWARDYGKHFCLHDLQDFFKDEKYQSISSIISGLTRQGKLIKAGSPSNCKMQTRAHSFWIYNGTTADTKRRNTRTKYGSKTHPTTIQLIRPENITRCPYCHHKVIIMLSRKRYYGKKNNNNNN